ncbi:MAG TPA: MaoC/PaaZ C-terminal domain-containing protein [Syntrophales bacterium]|nr:MaoC/PaaZ C-terminal domain-containing protein [Syntrophales bacterium]
MSQKCWEDFDIGFNFRTPSITVTETHVVNWAGLTMDFYPLHMDAEYCAKTVFKERIAHGPLIFGMAVGMAGLAKVEGGSILAWMGVDQMRMKAPVKFGDTITVHIETVEKKETSKPSQGLQTWRYTVKNQRDEAVMVFDMKFLMRRKGA